MTVRVDSTRDVPDRDRNRLRGQAARQLLLGLGALIAAGAAFGARPAAAAPWRVGVDSVGPATLPADLRQRLWDAAAAGLVASGAEVPGRDETARALLGGGAAPCADAECLRDAGGRLGVDHWLKASCELDASTYRFHLEMLDAKTGAVAAARDDKCEICTEAEAIDMINNGASTLKASLGQPTAPDVPAAVVAPAETPAPAPSPAGADLTTASPATQGQPSGFRRALPWMAIGVGVAAATTAGFFLLQNGSGRDCTGGVCYGVADNKAWAIPVLIAGGGLAITGAVLLALDAKDDATSTADATRQSRALRTARAERGVWAPRLTGIGIGPGGFGLTGTY